jgi:hypothetical protein
VRLSLSLQAVEGACSKCAATGPVLKFAVITDEHCGDADALCARCLFNPTGNRANVTMEPLVTGPAPRRKALKLNKEASRRQERDIAEEWGGRTQPGSGNQAGAKGDVRKKGELRIEAKLTQAESYSLKLDDLYKIAGEASHGELAVLFIDFNEPGTRKLRDRFAVIHSNDFKELHAAGQNRGPKRSA